MLLYLVRHGEAKSKEEDPAQGLTERGVRDVQKVAAFAGTGGLTTGRIFHSGKTRAMQTAQILAEHIKPREGILETDGLAPLDNPELWMKRTLERNEDMMLVGHLPYMGKLAALLLCGDKEKNIVDFKAGSLLCLKLSEDARWTVEWMIVPEVIT
jgi:phosphohistidine phosphatase